MRKIDDNQTIKDNVLIANFMGWDQFNTGSYHTPYDNASYCNGEETSICNKYALKFHRSWDWLMPVISKIKSFNIDEYTLIDKIDDALIYCNIEETHKAVVFLIHWYNKQQKQS